MASLGTAIVGAVGGMVIGMGLERSGGLEGMNTFVLEHGGMSLATLRLLCTDQLHPGFTSLYRSVKSLSQSLRSSPPEMLVAAPASPPPSSSSAAKPDPDAVSTVKLLAAATAAASVYGAFRLVQLYLGKDKLQRYVDTVVRKSTAKMQEVHEAACDFATRARQRTLTMVHDTYLASPAPPLVAAASGKCSWLVERARPLVGQAHTAASSTYASLHATASPLVSPIMEKAQTVADVAASKADESAMHVLRRAEDLLFLAHSKLKETADQLRARVAAMADKVVLTVRVRTGNGLVRAGVACHVSQSAPLDEIMSNLQALSKSLEHKYPHLVSELDELALRVMDSKYIKETSGIEEEKEYQVVNVPTKCTK